MPVHFIGSLLRYAIKRIKQIARFITEGKLKLEAKIPMSHSLFLEKSGYVNASNGRLEKKLNILIEDQQKNHKDKEEIWNPDLFKELEL